MGGARKKVCIHRCANWSELEIDHIIPLNGDPARNADLQSKGIIGTNFDVNGFENLLPTKKNLTTTKSRISSQMTRLSYFS